MSVSHSSSGLDAVNWRFTRSSWTGGPRLAGQAALLGEYGPDLLLGAQPGDPVLTRLDAQAGELAGDEPVPERRVVMVDAHRGVDQVCFIPGPVADWVLLPRVERLLAKAQHPAGHRDGDPVSGKVEDQREPHFGLISRAKNAAARRKTSFSCSSSLLRRRSSRSSADSAAVTPGRVPSSISASFSQRCRQDSEIPKSFAICETGACPLRATATTSRRNSIGNGLGTLIILPARTDPHRQGVNSTGGSPLRPYHQFGLLAGRWVRHE